MVPVIANGGASFKGAFAYYFHDKEAWTTARIAWTETRNLMTDCAEKAWKVMAYTAKSAVRLKEAAGQRRTGRKLEKPVFAYSLAWHPEQKPDKTSMLDAAKQSLKALGLAEHEAMISAHSDEPHPHLHIVVNRVHPINGMAAKISHSKRKLSTWARNYEQEHGKIYCMKREENHQKRQLGQNTKYVDPVINKAWHKSHDATEFQALLNENGYQLAQGRRRLVVVDAHGKTVNPARHIEGVRAKEFHERMASLNQKDLPTPEAILRDRQITKPANDQIAPEQGLPNDGRKIGGNIEAPEAEVTEDLNDVVPEGIEEKPDKEAKLRAYEDRVSAALNDLAGQHYSEWQEVSARHTKLIDTKRVELTETLKLEKRQEAIDALHKKLTSPNLIPKFARKLFGTDRKLEKRITNLRAQQEKAKKQFDTHMGRFTEGRAKDLQNLDARHTRKKRELSKHLEKWRPSTLSKSFVRSQESPAPTQEHEHTHDGPSLSR